MADARVPVTLLTGFLGAGKTTLLNAVLSDASAGRIAVIVNEFGDEGLDHDLIETSDEDVTLMQSGCLCCSLRGELVTTVADLLARRDDGALVFDRLVIETTGLAEPAPILQMLVTDAHLKRRTRLDGIVTVVDAVHGPATLDAQFEAVAQAAMADLIVLSKTDLAAPRDVRAVEARLRGINAGARIVHAVRGAGMSAAIWGLSGLRQDVAVEQALAWTTLPEAAPDPLANLAGLARSRAPASGQKAHDGRIVTASIVLTDPVDGDVFDPWLNDLVALRGRNLLRVKGILFLRDLEMPFVFHSVQRSFEPPMRLNSWSGGPRHSRIVIIARDVRHERLSRSLESLRDANAARVGCAVR